MMLVAIGFCGIEMGAESKDGPIAATGVKKVLVVYASAPVFQGVSAQQAKDNGIMMQNLLGHFDVEVTLCASKDYQQGQLDNFEAFFYVGTFQEKVPRVLLNDLEEWPGRVMWLGRNIDQWRAAGGLSLVTTLPGPQQVVLEYQGKRLVCPDRLRPNLVKQWSPDAEVWAWVVTPAGRWPGGIHQDNFWYLALADFHSKAYLLIADQLYNVLNYPPSNQKLATIRIEDVHPLRSPEKLRRIADELKSRNAPFMVTVFPVYANPAKGIRVHLRERPELVEALKYMVASGGSIMVHGYSHQAGEAESGQGFEFWDEQRECPLEFGENPDWAWERLNQAIIDLQALGLPLQGVTVPHYAMAGKTYRQLRQNIGLLAGCPQMSDRSRQTQKIPYMLKKDQYGYWVVPENLGYVAVTQEQPVAGMLQAAAEIAVVRDCTVGGFFHPYLDVRHLISLVEGLREQGFSFVDVRSLPVPAIRPDESP